jgi:hypothetical protein
MSLSLVDKVMALVGESYDPRPGQPSQQRLRDGLEMLFRRPFVDEQDLTAEDLNRLQETIVAVDERTRRPLTVVETETDHASFSTLVGEGVYHFILYLPWSLVALMLLTWCLAQVSSRTAEPEGLWGRWLLVAALGAGGVLVVAVLATAFRSRNCPPPWQFVEDATGSAVMFRRWTGQTARANPGEYEVRSSWLGRWFGLEWVWVGGARTSCPFPTSGFASSRNLPLTGERPSTDLSRSLWETAALVVTAFLVLFGVGRSVGGWFLDSRDDRVLLLLTLTAVLYLLLGWALSFLASRRAAR